MTPLKAIQKPLGIILSGNMLDEEAVLKLDTRLFFVSGERDWNLASQYAVKASITHNENYKLGSSSYVAQFADRKLLDTRTNTFHAGADVAILDWLEETCPVSMSI